MFNVCCRYFSGRPSAGWGVWNRARWKGLPRPCEALWLESSSVCMSVYGCVCVFLHAWAGNWKEWGSSQLMGCLEWDRPLGQQWDKVQLLFKVYRAVRVVYSSAAAGEGYKERGVKRWKNGEMWGEWRLGETGRKRSAYCKQKDVRADLHQHTDIALTELILRILSGCLRSQTKAFIQPDSRAM